MNKDNGSRYYNELRAPQLVLDQFAFIGYVLRFIFDTPLPYKRGGSCLPYASVDDLPPPIRARLPLHAQEIYLSAFLADQ